jgi:hypothetical protein
MRRHDPASLLTPAHQVISKVSITEQTPKSRQFTKFV